MKVVDVTRSEYHYDSFMITMESGERIRAFAEVLDGFGIFAGTELTESELESLRIACDCSDIEQLARDISASRPMSKRELARHLMDSGVKREWAEGTAIRLETVGAISDLDFARLLAKHLSSRNYGAQFIKAEMFERQIDESLWPEALMECPPPETILGKEIPKLLSRSGVKAKNLTRVTGEMLRRGFLIEDINKVIDEYISSL